MKKIIAIALVLTMALGATACSGGGGQSEGSAVDSMTLTDVMTAITADVEDMPMSENAELTADNFEAFAFVPYQDGYEGLVAEGMISSVAHSIVLVRVPDGTDASTVAKQIEENANPAKWICVNAEKTVVTVSGQTILLVMSFENVADAVSANFSALSK